MLLSVFFKFLIAENVLRYWKDAKLRSHNMNMLLLGPLLLKYMMVMVFDPALHFGIKVSVTCQKPPSGLPAGSQNF